MPGHVAEHIAITTGADLRGITRAAHPLPCPRCRAQTLAGLDGDALALPVRVDAVPLSPLGEAVAHLAGLDTWALTHRGGRLELDPRGTGRSLEAARLEPDGPERGDVLPEHSCGRTWRLAPTRTASRLPAPASADLPLDPPF